MSPTPTGRLIGDDLVLTRTFRASVDDVWASLTDPERTARWYGRWEGDAAPGDTIRVQMIQEEGRPWSDMTIDACEPPRRLALSSAGEYGWRLEMVLSEAAVTALNRSAAPQTISITLPALLRGKALIDALSGRRFVPGTTLSLDLGPKKAAVLVPAAGPYLAFDKPY